MKSSAGVTPSASDGVIYDVADSSAVPSVSSESDSISRHAARNERRSPVSLAGSERIDDVVRRKLALYSPSYGDGVAEYVSAHAR